MTKKKSNDKRKVEKQINSMGSNDLNLYKIGGMILIVICILGLFYLLSVFITNKNNNSSTSKKETSKTSIQYNEILAGSSFDMNENEYLVVYYDESSKDSSELTSKLSSYNSSTLYTVDLSSRFNKSVVTEGDSNYEASKASELALHNPTLIKFNKGSIVDYEEGYDDILEYLG